MPAVPLAVVALVITGAAVRDIVVPVVEVEIDDPPSETATPFPNWIEDDVSLVEPETVNASVATLPLASALELVVHITHVDVPEPFVQLMSLGDVTSSDAISLVE